VKGYYEIKEKAVGFYGKLYFPIYGTLLVANTVVKREDN